MKKLITLLLGAVLAVGGLLGLASPASAHSSGVVGSVVCDNGSWVVTWTYTLSNVPSHTYSETKEITVTSGGTLSVDPSDGKIFGGQVFLSAWPEHSVNYPGVANRRGNWSAQFTVTYPGSMSGYVKTMIQTDFKPHTANSRDDEGKVKLHGDCDTPPPPPLTDVCPNIPGDQAVGTDCNPPPPPPTDACPNIPGDQAAGTNCNPPTPPPTKPDVSTQYRDFTRTNCVRNVQRHVWQERDVVSGVPRAWHTTKVTKKHVGNKVCHAKKIRLHLKVTDRCRCLHDSVKITGKHVTVSSVRQNKNTWKIRVVADRGYLVPKNIKRPGGKYVHRAKYIIHTTNKPCPCQVTHTCKPKPPPTPKSPCGCKP